MSLCVQRSRRPEGRRWGALVWIVLLGVSEGGLAYGEEGAAPFWFVKGESAFEARVFDDDGDSRTEDVGLALTGRFEAKGSRGSWRSQVRLFGRADATDSDRRSVVVEEAWVEHRRGRWRFRVGAELFNWSATEAFHPADVVNSRNLDSDLESFEKLGEPIIGTIVRIPAGEVSAFYLPVRVDPKFPSAESRLSFAPAGWEVEDPLWIGWDGEVDDDDFGDQWLVRVLQSRGPADVDLHVLRHFDRSQPVVLVDPERQSAQPVFLPVTQIGGTVQAVLGSWVAKLEWAHRTFESGVLTLPESGTVSVDQSDHQQVAMGVEYGTDAGLGATGTWLLEAQAVVGANRDDRASLSTFQRDVLVGYRHDWNDIPGRRLTVTLIGDIERSDEWLLSLAYFQRLGDSWGLDANLRWIDAEPRVPTDPVGLERLDGDHQLRFVFRRYF